MCGLPFLSVCRSRCTSNFRAVCGFWRNILFLVKNLEYFFDKGRWKHKSKRVQCVQITQTARNCTHCTPLPLNLSHLRPHWLGAIRNWRQQRRAGGGSEKVQKEGNFYSFTSQILNFWNQLLETTLQRIRFITRNKEPQSKPQFENK